MASAAQLAWRKKFAAMARAGTLPKKKASTRRKKNPAAAPPPANRPTNLLNRAPKARRKNPSGRSGKELNQNFNGEDGFQDNPAGRQVFIATRSKAKALAEAERKGINAPIAVKLKSGYVVYSAYSRNPSGRSGANLPSQFSGEDDFALMSNPRRRGNPAAHRAPAGFAVHRVNAHGEPVKTLARFGEKKLAVEYARAYAEAHKVSVGVTGKAR